MSNFQNPKVPPTGGSHLPHAHPSSFEITEPVPTRGAGDGFRDFWRCRVKARCIGRRAGLNHVLPSQADASRGNKVHRRGLMLVPGLAANQEARPPLDL
jgi:hypothetical protein